MQNLHMQVVVALVVAKGIEAVAEVVVVTRWENLRCNCAVPACMLPGTRAVHAVCSKCMAHAVRGPDGS